MGNSIRQTSVVWHVEIHMDLEYFCKYCKKIVKTRNILNNHISNYHREERYAENLRNKEPRNDEVSQEGEMELGNEEASTNNADDVNAQNDHPLLSEIKTEELSRNEENVEIAKTDQQETEITEVNMSIDELNSKIKEKFEKINNN